MNEIQIIQNQLATERAHFTEVANICAAALDQGKLSRDSSLAAACADYFAFAATRLAAGLPTLPGVTSSESHWRDFLRAFNEQATQHFTAIDTLRGSNPPVTEWRARSRINADSIVMERERYARVKAAVP